MSSQRAEPLDLERDLKTTPEDVVALRRLRQQAAPSWKEYLRFARQLGDAEPAALRARPGPRGERPFELATSSGREPEPA